jgi:hypothetical protein
MWSKGLRATTSCGNVFCLGSGLSNTHLFAGRPRHQRRSQKLASPRSGLPIQLTPGKIRVWRNVKRQRRRRGVPKAEVGSVTQVLEYALDCLPMRSPWRHLKTSAQTYRELDVWPRRRQVEEWPDHAPVLLLVHVFTFLIRIKSYSHTHYVKTSNRSRSICNGSLTPVTSTHICNGCHLAPVTYKRARTTPGLASTMPVTNMDFLYLAS